MTITYPSWLGAAAGVAVILALYGYGLGAYPLLDPDEGRYAEIPREMLESGDFITPHLNYVKYLEKPPLFYWLTAVALALGKGEEWALRLVPVSTALGTVLVCVGLGCHMFGRRAGLLAGWVYATSLLPIIIGRLLIIDGLFSFTLTMTWAAWWMGYRSETPLHRRAWYTASWACLALATLAKGPTALVLTGLLVFGFLTWRRDWGELKRLAWWPGLVVYLAVALPWFVLVSVRNPEFPHYFVVVQHLLRFGGREHAKPFWFFLPIVVGGMGAWAPLMLAQAAQGLRRWFRGVPTNYQIDRADDPAPQYLLVWVFAVVGFFSASECKLVPYILPAFPALALLVARSLAEERLGLGGLKACAVVTAALLTGAAFLLPLPAHNQDSVPPAALDKPVFAAQVASALAVALFGLSVRHPRTFPIMCGLHLPLLVPALVWTVDTVAQYRRTPDLVRALPLPLPPQVRVAQWRNYDQSLGFYLQRRITLVDELDELEFGSQQGDQSAYFLQGAESLRRLARDGPLLANLRPEDWPEVRSWGVLKPVAANSRNVLAANDAFFDLVGVEPWSGEAVRPGPLLLLPRRGSEAEPHRGAPAMH